MVRTPVILATLALALTLAAPVAQAQDSVGTLVGGVVDSEVAVQVLPAAQMAFSPSRAGTTSALVTVTSTLPSWTLTVRDDGATTPGYLDRVSGSGSLPQPLEWKYGGGSYTALTGTAATVTTGALTGTRLVEFRQLIGPEASVAAGDQFSLTATFRVH